MPRTAKLEGHLRSDELQQRYLRCDHRADRTRWHALWLVSLGKSGNEAARLVGRTSGWVSVLVRSYNERGTEGVETVKRKGQQWGGSEAALRWGTEQYQIDPDKIGIFGHSAGGHIAALTAVTGDMPELEGDGGSLGYSSKVQAFAAASAPYDFLTFGGAIDDDAEFFQRMFGGKISERESLARLASPLTHVSPSTPPGLVAHGTLDETAPFRHAELFSNKLRAHNVEHEFHALEGCYHNWSTSLDSWSGFGNEDDFYVMARSFFEKQFL